MEPTAIPPNQPEPAPPAALAPQIPSGLPPQTVQPSNVFEGPPPAPAPPPPDHKRLTIIVIAVTVIIVGALLVYILVFANKDKASSPPGAGVVPILNDQQQARDTKRKTDMNALQAQTEAFQAENGFYPSLANINDPTWRAANMQGLDSNALEDPLGSSEKLVSTPAKDVYAYEATPDGCDNSALAKQCTGYTLTATLEEGGTFTKYNLN